MLANHTSVILKFKDITGMLPSYQSTTFCLPLLLLGHQCPCFHFLTRFHWFLCPYMILSVEEYNSFLPGCCKLLNERESLQSNGERVFLIKTLLREVVEMGWCTPPMQQGSHRPQKFWHIELENNKPSLFHHQTKYCWRKTHFILYYCCFWEKKSQK